MDDGKNSHTCCGGNNKTVSVALIVIAMALVVLAGFSIYSNVTHQSPNITCSVTFGDQTKETKAGLTGYMDAMAWMTVIEKQRGKAITAFECD